MTPCISQVTTLSTPFEADLPAFARSGWSAVELWLTKLETFLQSHPIAEARSLLDGEGLTPAAAAGQGGLLLSRGAERALTWDHFRRRLEALAELGVPTLVVAADSGGEPTHETYNRAAESLAEAAALAGPLGVRLALEFVKTSRFCASLDTALALIARADGDNLGVCLDLFHYETGPSKPGDLAYLNPANLAWVQVSDLGGVPREAAGDADRVLPGDGDIAAGPILGHLRRVGYDGFVSLEVLNPELWRVPAGHLADLGRRATARLLEAGRVEDPSGGP
ncbi:MAG TPA: sugar phosphate isomerase/epimerase [Isosphaeraceae bacterium]|jgi:sugar phosphate isomerase/epimerase|nr:sugar phosphate isomerase/epimerase [Isosphaeraceae bacterium]